MKYLYILLATLCMVSCDDTVESPAGEEMPLVVEGWIEEGESPVVIVTHAIDLTAETPSLDDFVEKWGRVTIYDDDREYILTGRVNESYTPSLIFTSARLKGKVGHTYRLTVETESGFAEAAVKMEPAPRISSVTPVEEGEGYSLNVRLTEAEGTVQFQTRTVPDEGRFYLAFCGTMPAGDVAAEGFAVTRGIHASYDDEQAYGFSHFFSAGETVIVKVCRIPDDLLPFWTAYEHAVSLGGNLLLSMPQNCRGNITGGLGYFTANGISTVAVTL